MIDNVIYLIFWVVMCISVYVWINIIKNTPNPEGSVYDKNVTHFRKPITMGTPSSYL